MPSKRPLQPLLTGVITLPKSLPVTVDKSYVQATIEGCHHNTFMYRVKGTDGKFQDTNDSSVDVKIEHRSDFKGYPEGWRNE